jgi:hypothetical protein
MEAHKKIERPGLFDTYSEEINRAYERAVREALLRHKQAGNSIVVERDGKLVILQPDEIEVD